MARTRALFSHLFLLFVFANVANIIRLVTSNESTKWPGLITSVVAFCIGIPANLMFWVRSVGWLPSSPMAAHIQAILHRLGFWAPIHWQRRIDDALSEMQHAVQFMWIVSSLALMSNLVLWSALIVSIVAEAVENSIQSATVSGLIFGFLQSLGVLLLVLDTLAFRKDLQAIQATSFGDLVHMDESAIRDENDAVVSAFSKDQLQHFYDPFRVEQRHVVIDLFLLILLWLSSAPLFMALEGWTFGIASSFFVVSLSTVGYGTIVPTSPGSRLLFLAVSIVGLGLMASFLASFGSLAVISLRGKLETSRYSWIRQYGAKVAILSSAILIWVFGTVLFMLLEPWTFLDSLYFCFVTLTTIGFGDLYPSSPVSLGILSIYIFGGVAIFAIFVAEIWRESREEQERKWTQQLSSQFSRSADASH